MASNPRGSMWARWDLHVHTPDSIVNEYPGNRAEAWRAFIDELKSLPPEIKVVAICDYLFIDGYEEVLRNRSELTNLELILPSIEFRLDTFAGSENNIKRHNYHVIFGDEVSPQIIREQFLNGIQRGYFISTKEEWNQNPTPRSLQELGRVMKANAPADNSIRSKSDLEAGFDNITYNRKELEKLLDRDHFRNKHLTAIGYTEWSHGKWDQSAVSKRDILSSSAFCLTNNDNEEVIAGHIQALKAINLNSRVLHSSDAHKLDRLASTKLWVKADTTFNGLRIALSEYDDRIFIGSDPGNLKQDSEVIDSITIKNSSGWFEDNLEIKLNPDMTSVIGGRGAGKSALIEMIAYTAGAFEESVDTFISKAKRHKRRSISGTQITLKWLDGSKTEAVIDGDSSPIPLVQYLPQKYVEKIVDPQDSRELTGQIERVVFNALGDAERQGASSFTDLQAKTVSPLTRKKETIAANIFTKNQEIAAKRKEIDATPAKREEARLAQASINQMNQTLPKLSQEDEIVHTKLEKLEAERYVLEQGIGEQKRALTSIEDISLRSTDYLKNIDQIERWLLAELAALGVDEKITEGLTFTFDASLLERTILQLKSEATNKIEKLTGGSKTEIAAITGKPLDFFSLSNLGAYNVSIDTERSKLKAHQTLRARYAMIKERVTQLTRRKVALDKEIAQVASVTEPELATAIKERNDLYGDYLALIGKEKAATERLYHPLEEHLAREGHEGSSQSRLNFTAKVVHEINEQVDAGLNLIDRSRKGPFRDHDGLRDVLANYYADLESRDFDPDYAKQAIVQLERKFSDDNGTPITIKDQLRSSFGQGDFDNWLYDPKYFVITPSIQFDGVDINLLSPGQRGIVLLSLYLSIDDEDRRPLLVDQPEDNLDNLSVYRELIESFRSRKTGRQIIIITHNPNLVVNTDSEQVIVAHFDGKSNPRISYKMGSLENKADSTPGSDEVENGIIEEVCDILEGGGIAMNKRQRVSPRFVRKYIISPV